jgi:hypothetical protein
MCDTKTSLLNTIKEKFVYLNKQDDEDKLKKLSFGEWVKIYGGVKATKIIKDNETYVIYLGKENDIIPKEEHKVTRECKIIWGSVRDVFNNIYKEGDTIIVNKGDIQGLKFLSESLLIVRTIN